MMICPETYYNECLKGKTAEQILSTIRGLKRKMNRLKNIMEHPDYRPMYCPGEDVQISCMRDYLARAKSALVEAGGVYVPTKAEQRAELLDSNLAHLSKMVFCAGGFSGGYKTRTYTVCEDRICVDFDDSMVFDPSKRGNAKVEEIDKADFLHELADLHIGEWRREYSPGRFGYAVLDGTEWELRLEFSNGSKPIRFEGSNAYPYNFKQLMELLEFDDD